ncbi:MAG: hypothetical protein JWQ24_5564, partial [Tardiphaga sp.]|nr:hypothetical protein [Tardiphaga sp.]
MNIDKQNSPHRWNKPRPLFV